MCEPIPTISLDSITIEVKGRTFKATRLPVCRQKCELFNLIPDVDKSPICELCSDQDGVGGVTYFVEVKK